jgi:hypothetical protein
VSRIRSNVNEIDALDTGKQNPKRQMKRVKYSALLCTKLILKKIIHKTKACGIFDFHFLNRLKLWGGKKEDSLACN